MEIKKMLLTPNIYSRPQTALKRVTKVAVHYVGGAGAKAVNVRNYFESLKSGARYASSHYIVGLEGEIIQCIPENEVAYCTNQANSYSISIENCHPRADGIFTAATRESLKRLCADICTRYGLDPVRDIIRHYDVTGKHCPLCWVNDPTDFKAFKNEVREFMEGGVDMEELKKLAARVDELETELENSREKVFENLEDIPAWGKATVEKLIKKGCLKGDGSCLDLTYTLLRLLVINDRAGTYGA